MSALGRREKKVTKASKAKRVQQAKRALEIMTPANPRWNEFCDDLHETMTAGLPEGTWRCDGDGYLNNPLVHQHAKAIMTKMGNINIEASLAFFREHGGGCDCEILWNVDPDPP